MSNVKAKLGRMPCENRTCGEPVMVRQAPATKTLSYTCQSCDKSSFAKWGSDCAKAWLQQMPQPQADPEPAPAPAPKTPKPSRTAAAAPTPQPAPAEAGGFHLSF